MKFYIKTRIWDWLFLIVISTGLVFHIYSGFELDYGLAQNVPLVIACMAGLHLIYLLFSYEKRTRILGIILVVVVLMILIVYGHASHIFDEEAANATGIAVICTIATSFVCYLATRTRVATIVLLVVGNLVCAGSHFLQFPVETWQLIVFIAGTVAMLGYRNYMMTVLQVHSGKVRLHRYAIQILIGIAAVCLLTTGLYLGVVKPLNPPTRQLTLITKLERMDLLSKIGVSSLKEYLDPNLLSQSQKQLELASQLEEQQQQEQTEEEDKEQSQQNANGSIGVNLMHYDFTKYTIPLGIIVLAIIVFLLVGQWFIRRKKWKKQVTALSYEGQVNAYYRFFLKALKRAGYQKPNHHTLYEYSESLSHEMQAFDGKEASFEQLTDIYIKMVYGEKVVCKEEVSKFEKYYEGFFKNLKKEIGLWKYLRKIWFLATA
ncbi:hypothetical protein [Eubacterium oxidoreducens]|uniref:DUF4129 domain-containing protein n=1 Tax=Eubacterium oxidoreducens TaxID=1732 RepID=A0A1G6A053_EUBOX|nr:hypothetical protein [Eubacterium oxidoreducens]SDB01765.1 hypothetical protein SAMN02910417_00068 [Eubacterium oxidoreducens]